MARAERSGADEALDLERQGEEPNGVGEVGASIAGKCAQEPVGLGRGLAQALERGPEDLGLGDGVDGYSGRGGVVLRDQGLGLRVGQVPPSR